MNEAETRAKLIDPSLHRRGWTEDHIRREETAGSIVLIDDQPRKLGKGRVDYILRLRLSETTQPVAVAIIEAKAEYAPPNQGLEQVKRYGKLSNVPFVYSSNGHLFVEYDAFTGKTSKPKPLSQFPTPQDLQARYEQHKGFKLDAEIAKPLLTPYRGGEASRRYYQDAAIRAVFEKIASCYEGNEALRALLSLATGAGKTYIATQILCRIADAGLLRRALFICDRTELRDQASGALKGIFGDDVAVVSGKNPQKNARILVTTYQTLDVDSNEDTGNFLVNNYPENYFSHIIIDECHRSAWGKWSLVLTRNPDAVQIGLTATPRKLETTEDTPEVREDLQITADNLRYFGEPVYEYDIGQGIEDGYLAVCSIHPRNINLDHTGITIEEILARNPVDSITGQPVTEEEIRERYECTSYERRIELPDRVLVMCQDLFSALVQRGKPEQKTVIFCVSDKHADEVAITMNNIYVDWCGQNNRQPLPDYAFKCTAKGSGNDYLPDLKESSRSHFIATTVDLLTTGVDVPPLENIAFFRYMRSPLTFYQMIGRGTRLHPPSGKLMFRVYDYTNATRLFGVEFLTKLSPRKDDKTGNKVKEKGGSYNVESQKIITVEGFDVRISAGQKSILTMVNGETIPVSVEEYRERLGKRLMEEVSNITLFREIWIKPNTRNQLMSILPDGGRSPLVLRAVSELEDYDLFDILGELGYGIQLRTRKQRAEAFEYKQEKWLEMMPKATGKTIKAITAQFAQNGTEELENPKLFQLPMVKKAGGINALKEFGDPKQILLDTKMKLFAA
ncbi:type I restriction-modification system [Geminocystis sp. NIES-3708]|uniref:type I restriction endonuclease subunit R n=1 Tax=Geminocystis sp. NIES-3708 TaxID=1615909 RepID=UPI0005FCD048|nr:type I restriction endonuclease subunit R [Geminocystis sp. NIES-3708]BAQ62910.1 type I restriction-modification system [Geminocystis sp. NIES-3708]